MAANCQRVIFTVPFKESLNDIHPFTVSRSLTGLLVQGHMTHLKPMLRAFAPCPVQCVEMLPWSDMGRDIFPLRV